MTYRILVTDEIDAEGVALLAAEPGLSVEEVPTLPKDKLLERIGQYDAIVGRSATRISPELLRAGKNLKVIGRAGVGVDNIALDVATELGIAVINAPAGNTVAVAELFFGVTLSILRHLTRANVTMHEGAWERSNLLGSELRGRTLGIVGLGRIGGEITTRAHAFGMNVVAYDPYVAESRFATLRVERMASLEDLLEKADILTVHTPLNDETVGMIGKRELARLAPKSIVVNMARGGIIEENALIDALASGHLSAAAVDVFMKEPLDKDHPLRKAPNLFLTPHLGASTIEGQRNVSVDVCVAVRDALLNGELSQSINIAEVESGKWIELRPVIQITRNAAAIGRAVLAGQGALAVGRVEVRCGPQLLGARNVLLAAAALGVLDAVVEHDRLNIINSRSLAEARGIELSFTDASTITDPQTVEVRVSSGMQDISVAASGGRIIRIGAFHVDVQPRTTMLILTNKDVPGVIGRVGTLLGEKNVNIAEYHQARLAQGGEALAAVSVDGKIDEDIRKALLQLPDVNSATVVHFRSE